VSETAAAPEGGSVLSDEQQQQLAALMLGPQPITNMTEYHQMIGALVMESAALKAHIGATHGFLAQLVPPPPAEPDALGEAPAPEPLKSKRKRAPLSIVDDAPTNTPAEVGDG
jgi:hypothetical protein